MVNNFDMLFLLFSISLLGMGILSSISQGLYFYTLICVLNLVAWYLALITDKER